MNPLTVEWIQKAEEDFAAAVHLSRMRRKSVPSIVCFHCQQCAEKYLKARLQEARIDFPKTHNLKTLLDLALPVEPLWETLRAALQKLSDYAVVSRYPGEEASPSEAREVLQVCRDVRREIRQSLGLQSRPGSEQDFRVREKKGRYRAKRRRK